MSVFFSRYTLLISVLTSLSIYLWSLSLNGNLELPVAIFTGFVLIFALILESLIPYKKKWQTNKGDLRNDLVSAAVLLGLVDPMIKLAASALVIMAYSSLDFETTMSYFSIASLPLAFEIVLAAILIEFGLYWCHRFHHALIPLWRLHAMHHSSKRLYTLNNFRFHPVNYGLNFSMGMFPAMLLGFSPEALFGYLAISQPVLMLQHANIDLRNGWLNYIFSTNELHRWHHSSSSAQANSNYGTSLVLWDHIFGTFRFTPDYENEPKHVGLFSSNEAFPENGNYLQQLIAPFKFSCC